MTTIESIIPRVTMVVPDVPYPSAELAIRDSAVEFCRNSLFLRAAVDAVDVVVGEVEYDLSSEASSSRVVRLFDAWLDGARLTPLSVYDLGRTDADWTSKTGQPFGYTMTNESTIRLYPIPEATGTLTAYGALAPDRRATSLDDALVDRWMDALVFGALARVLFAPGREYHDPAASQAYRLAFAEQIQLAKIELAVGQTTKTLTVNARAFGG